MMKGLQTDFRLHNGAFLLTEGSEKAADALKFFTLFNKFRVYVSDFGSNFISLLQKPTSYIQANGTILLSVYKNGVKKYVPSVEINSLDIGYLNNDRKNHVIQINYSLTEGKTKAPNVIFI